MLLQYSCHFIDLYIVYIEFVKESSASGKVFLCGRPKSGFSWGVPTRKQWATGMGYNNACD